MKFNTSTAKAEIRIWDDVTSDSFFVDDWGNTYNADGEKTQKWVWGHILDADSTGDAAAIQEIISDWAEDYDGDSCQIRAEINRL